MAKQYTVRCKEVYSYLVDASEGEGGAGTGKDLYTYVEVLREDPTTESTLNTVGEGLRNPNAERTCTLKEWSALLRAVHYVTEYKLLHAPTQKFTGGIVEYEGVGATTHLRLLRETLEEYWEVRTY